MKKLFITVSAVAMSFSSACCVPSWASSYEAVRRMHAEWNAMEDLSKPSWVAQDDQKRKLEDLEAAEDLAGSSQPNSLTQQTAAKASKTEPSKFTHLLRGSSTVLLDNITDLYSIKGQTFLGNASRSRASHMLQVGDEPLVETDPVDFFESVSFNDFNFAGARIDAFKHPFYGQQEMAEAFYRVIKMAESFESHSKIGFHQTIKEAFGDEQRYYNAERNNFIVCQFEIADFFCNVPNLAETNPVALQKLVYNLGQIAKRTHYTNEQRANACLAIANLADKKIIPRLAEHTTPELYVAHCNSRALDYLKYAQQELGSDVAAFRAAELIERRKFEGSSIEECLRLYSIAANTGNQDAHYRIAHVCACLGYTQAYQLHDSIFPIVSPTATYLLQNNATAEGAYRLAQLYRLHLVPKPFNPIIPIPVRKGVPKASIGTSAVQPKPLHDDTDHGYSLKYFLKAANMGHMSAACMAYSMLKDGVGCMPNAPEAKKMLLKAAELGDIPSKWNFVTSIYKDVNRTKEDQKLAIHFLEEMSLLNEARTHDSNLYLARIFRHNVESSSRFYTTEDKRFRAVIQRTMYYYFTYICSPFVTSRPDQKNKLEDAMLVFRPFLTQYQGFMTDIQKEVFTRCNATLDELHRHPAWEEVSHAAIDQLDPILLFQVGRQLQFNN